MAKPKTCNRCKKTGLVWKFTSSWRLHESNGDPHVCVNAPNDMGEEMASLKETLIEQAVNRGMDRTTAQSMRLQDLNDWIIKDEPKPALPTALTQPTASSSGLPDDAGKVLAAMVAPHLRLPQLTPDMVERAVEKVLPKPITIIIETPNSPPVKLEKVHRQTATLIKLLNTRKLDGSRLNILMVGPAGSMKTTAASVAAKALDLTFDFTSVCEQTTVFDLIGYQDANGRYIGTAFRERFEHGGIFLLDEMDAGNANVLAVTNAALSNGHYRFPDRLVEKHPDFICIAAGNTYGRGADRMFVGRNQLDGATLDRFTTIYWDYDEQLELEVAGRDQIEWTKYVHKVRAAIIKSSVRHIVSSRAALDGAALLRAGFPRAEVESMRLWCGLGDDDIAKVKSCL